MVVVRGADEVTDVALFEQLEDEAAGEEREIVGVGLDGGEDLANMRLAFGDAFDVDVHLGEGALVGRCRPCVRRRNKRTGRDSG